MTVVENPDDQAALKAKAAAQGLTLEGWLEKLADPDVPADQFKRAQAAAARIREISKRSKAVERYLLTIFVLGLS